MARVNDFFFVGSVPASKSLMNRALIVQSYFPHLEIHGESASDDVRFMREALKGFAARQPMDCGQAGTVLRFLALRAAREPGDHELRGSARLMSRLPDALLRLLRQLGAEAEIRGSALHLRSWGWKPSGDCLHVPVDQSSQFASAVLLNSWALPTPLHFVVPRSLVSQGYWRMTVAMMKRLGLQIDQSGSEYSVPARQRVVLAKIAIEPDMSSAFALAAIAAVAGQARFSEFPAESLQPDASFPRLLQTMGVPVERDGDHLIVKKAPSLRAIDWNVSDGPDVFPVLVALCALAEGESRITGGSQLAVKESDRIAKMSELLTALGADHQALPDGLIVRGPLKASGRPVLFDAAEDHRLVMAAAVLRKAGFPITVCHPEVVAKSFPEFLETVGAWP